MEEHIRWAYRASWLSSKPCVVCGFVTDGNFCCRWQKNQKVSFPLCPGCYVKIKDRQSEFDVSGEDPLGA